MSAVAAWLRRGWDGVAWYARSLTGEAAFDAYYARLVEHHRRDHPGEPVPDRGEVWRRRTDEAAARPRARCC